MIKYNLRQHLIRFLVRLRIKRWILPTLCAVPYFLSLLWLIGRDQVWIAQVMLAPILMTLLLGALTLLLDRAEFRR